MTEEEKPTVKKVVVKKVVKKVAPASSASQPAGNSKPIVNSASALEKKIVATNAVNPKSTKPVVSSEAKPKTVTKSVETQSTKLIAKPKVEQNMKPIAQPISQEAAITKKDQWLSQNKKPQNYL